MAVCRSLCLARGQPVCVLGWRPRIKRNDSIMQPCSVAKGSACEKASSVGGRLADTGVLGQSRPDPGRPRKA